MKLTAEIIEAFAGAYLSPRYDSAQPTPDFHRECWERYCRDHPACATAAPRNHAKSTALTDDYGLAAALFRSDLQATGITLRRISASCEGMFSGKMDDDPTTGSDQFLFRKSGFYIIPSWD